METEKQQLADGVNWLPVIIVRGSAAHGPFKTHEEVYVRYKRDEKWNVIPSSYVRVYVSFRLWRWLTLPERMWRFILGRLWHDRLAYQYEAGYAAGLKEGLTNAEAINALTPEERQAITEY